MSDHDLPKHTPVLMPWALLRYIEEENPNYGIPVDPRAGTEPYDAAADAFHRRRARNGRVAYRCDLTERTFTLPIGVQPPALLYRFPEADQACALTVHPDVMKGGEPALRQAMQECVERLVAKIHEQALDAFELERLLEQEIRPAWPDAWPK